MTSAAQPEPAGGGALLAALATAVLLALATWFSGTAAAPSLAAEWVIDRVGVPA